MRLSRAKEQLEKPEISWFRNKETGLLIDADPAAAERLRAPLMLVPESVNCPEGKYRQSVWEPIATKEVKAHIDKQHRNDHPDAQIAPLLKGNEPKIVEQKPLAPTGDQVEDLNSISKPSAEVFKSK